MSEETMQDDVVEEAVATPVVPDPFALVKERVTVAHLNLRTEKKGPDDVPAVDIKLSLKTANSILKKLRPGLLEDFYTRDRQGDVEDDFLRKLKHPQMGPVSWEFELPRALLRFHDIDSEENDIVLSGGRANGFKLTMLDGGTVQLDFRVQFREPDPESIAKLMAVQKQVIPISLSSAEEEAKADNFKQAELLGSAPDKMSDARKNAERAFVGAVTSPEEISALPSAEPEPAPQ